MTKTWILVADGARARLFETDTPRNELAELESFVNAEGRRHERDLISDRPGRAFDSAGEGRHAMGTHDRTRDHDALEFAQDLAHRLEAGCQEHGVEQFVLVAPPRFLGQLRTKLGTGVERRVVREIAKDLTQHSADEVRALLGEGD
jgi:protein required for attachment to host cells